MTYQNQISLDIQSINSKLDDIEEIIVRLPIRVGQKRIIKQMIYDLLSEVECAVECSSVDFE